MAGIDRTSTSTQGEAAGSASASNRERSAPTTSTCTPLRTPATTSFERVNRNERRPAARTNRIADQVTPGSRRKDLSMPGWSHSAQ
jgi:hypothetical protein